MQIRNDSRDVTDTGGPLMLIRSWNTTSPRIARGDVKYEEITDEHIEDFEQQILPGQCGLEGMLPRSESMELVNDPRFFLGSVVEKRLLAFQGLTVLGTLFVSSSIMQMFVLKKNMNLGELLGWLQLVGFVCHMLVCFLLVTAVSVYVQQTFYIYRLLTAGPTGFEQASLFYLNESITGWRHFAMNGMLSGIPGFMLASGIELLVKFVKDAKTKYEAQLKFLANDLGASKSITAFRHFMHGRDTDGLSMGMLKQDWDDWKLFHQDDLERVPPLTSMKAHWSVAIAVFVSMFVFCLFLRRIRSQHLAAYQLLHLASQDRVDKLTTPLRSVGSTSRRGRLLEA